MASRFWAGGAGDRVRFFGGGNILPPRGWQRPLSIITEKPNWRPARTDQSSYTNTPWLNTAATYTCDAYLSNVVLLTGFEGADASTGAPGMTDESPRAHGTAGPLGNAQIDTAQFKFGTSSLLLDGTGDSIQFSTSTDWNFGAAQFTVECRVRPNSVAAGFHYIIGQWQGPTNLGWLLYLNGAIPTWIVSTAGTGGFNDLVGTALSTGTWYALAVDYDGTKYRMYIDGVMVASSSTARTIFPSTLNLCIGSEQSNAGNFFNGWIDEIRITRGAPARYASDSGYTPATAAFPRNSCGIDPYFSSVVLLMGYEGANGSTGAPGMTDESPALHGTATVHGINAISTAPSKFGISSLLCGGVSGGNITFADSSDWNLAAGLFTVEMWIYRTGGGTQFLVAQWTNSPTLGWAFDVNAATGELELNVSTTGSDTISVMTGGNVTANAWHFACMDFDGIKYRLYLNGIMVGSSTTLRTIFNSTDVLSIGANGANSAFQFGGYVDELRITKNVARYATDGGFTVPTARFPRQ